jgi:hypothetical protein
MTKPALPVGNPGKKARETGFRAFQLSGATCILCRPGFLLLSFAPPCFHVLLFLSASLFCAVLFSVCLRPP